MIALQGGQYGEIFSSNVAVLARPEGQYRTQELNIFPYCPTKSSAIYYMTG